MNQNYGTKRNYRVGWSRTAAATGLLGLTLLLAACGSTDEADAGTDTDTDATTTESETTTETESETTTETETTAEKWGLGDLWTAGPPEDVNADAGLVKTTEVLDGDTVRIETGSGEEEIVHLALVKAPTDTSTEESSERYTSSLESLEGYTTNEDGGAFVYWMERTGATDEEDGHAYVHLFQPQPYERSDAFHLNKVMAGSGRAVLDETRSTSDDPRKGAVQEASENARDESHGHWNAGEYQAE